MDIGYLTRHATWHLRSSDPDAPAVSLEDVETWSYRALHARANAVGNALLDAGVQPGDRVAMLLHNCLEYWAAYLGATRIGAWLAVGLPTGRVTPSSPPAPTAAQPFRAGLH